MNVVFPTRDDLVQVPSVTPTPSSPAPVVLDLGCGTGVIATELAQWSHPIGLDMSSQALAYCRQRGVEDLVQANGEALPIRTNSVDAVLALDIFEHIEDDQAAFREAFRVLRPGGVLVMSVPAFRWLWGPHDIAFNTGRRWRAHDLVCCLQSAGLVIERTTYANSLLSPAIVAMRLLQRWGWLEVSPADEEGSLLSSLLARTLGAEARWLVHHKYPFGISFYVLARKPKHLSQNPWK